MDHHSQMATSTLGTVMVSHVVMAAVIIAPKVQELLPLPCSFSTMREIPAKKLITAIMINCHENILLYFKVTSNSNIIK